MDIPENARLTRQMYADGATIEAIMAATGFNHYNLYKWVDGVPQKDSSTLLEPLPRRRMVASRRMLDAERAAFVMSLMRTADWQLKDIQRRLNTPESSQDTDSRTLAVLARTMRELTALDALNRMSKKQRKTTPVIADAGRRVSESPQEQPVPDIEELRHDLSRRLDQVLVEATELPDEQAERG